MVGVITGILINVLSTYLTQDRELIRLQKEELRLNIEKLKRELEEGKKENLQFDLSDSVFALNKNIKIIKHKSNFYKHLSEYRKVTKVTTALLTNKNEPVNDPTIVEREEFKKFILSTDKLQPVIDENATIEIISPVLKKGKFKWRGIYKDEVIPFSMRDKDFKNQVIQNSLPFKNGTCIDCILNISRKISEVGTIISDSFSVITVLRFYDTENVSETPKGKKYRLKKKYEKMQTEFFTKNDNNRLS